VSTEQLAKINDKVFRPIEQKSVSSQIIDQFKTLISSGKLRPGDPLPPERQLMKVFGVSRPTLREALNALSTMGFVTMAQRRRTRVRSLVPSNITEPLHRLLEEDLSTSLELIEARSIIEVGSVRLAAKRATSEDIAHLERCQKSMEENIAVDKSLTQGDAEFHLSIAEASHNKIQIHLMFSVHDLLSKMVSLCYVGDDSVAILAQHQAIVKAIKNRDEEQAAVCMEEHLSYVKTLIERTINKP
jgi:GntR family transcriptional repressor for pyruvate dehydrogenase complex